MTTALLDFAALTAPLAGEQPAGVRLPPEVRKKLEEARKEFEPNPDDPSQPPIPKKPDWAAIIKLASDVLTKTSKDIQAAARLTEALAKRHGFAGLRDGLTLLRLLLTDAWDRVHPVIEGPEDFEYRAGPITWLSDPESGAWFPASLKKLPLLNARGQLASLDDCERGRVGDQPLSGDDLRDAKPAEATTVEDVAECLKELEAIDAALVAKIADQAPNLASLRDVLESCQRYLGNLRVTAAAEAPAPSADGAVEIAPTSAPGPTGVANRAETYRQLARLADDLALLEPHSPIPDLLRWAVTLGNMPFRELIQELVSEPGMLAEIRRRFGIKESNAGEA